MSQLIRTEDSAHFYTKDGHPMHRVPKKDGKGDKNTTIKEARELNLLPSVTTILKLYPKKQLDNWKIEQAILAALTLPQNLGEDMNAFAKRVVEDSQAQAIKAAEFGTKVHNAIAGELIDDELVRPFYSAWCQWRDKNITKEIWQEKVIVNPSVGYAGRADSLVLINNEEVLVDFKCRTVKDRAKPPVYETDLMQLVAYAKQEGVDRVASIIIDSQVPGEPILHVWDQSEYEHHWQCFLACHTLWTRINKYTP